LASGADFLFVATALYGKVEGGSRSSAGTVGEDQRLPAGTPGRHAAAATAKSDRNAGAALCSPGSRGSEVSRASACDGNHIWRRVGFGDRSWYEPDPGIRRVIRAAGSADRGRVGGVLWLRSSLVRAGQYRD